LTDPALEPWTAWVALSLQLHGIHVDPGLALRAARTLSRLAPMAGGLAAGGMAASLDELRAEPVHE